MTRRFTAGAVLMLLISTAWADPYTIIKQRARSAANRPLPPPVRRVPVQPAQPMVPIIRTAPTTPTNSAASAALTAAQQAALKQLIGDLNAIRPNAKATAEQCAKVQSSLTALADSATPPPAKSVEQLSQALAAGWGTQKMTDREQMRLAKEVCRVLNSAALSAQEAQSAVNSAKMVLRFGGMDENGVQKIVEALTAVATSAEP